jgi:hypothetical protein
VLTEIILEICENITDHGVRMLVSSVGKGLDWFDLRTCEQLSDESVLAVAEHCPLLRWFGFPPYASKAALAQVQERCVHLTQTLVHHSCSLDEENT